MACPGLAVLNWPSLSRTYLGLRVFGLVVYGSETLGIREFGGVWNLAGAGV